MMKTTSELLECIKGGLLMGASDSRALREGGIADSDITDAQTALAELRQRVVAMQQAIDEWETINIGDADMDEAMMICDRLSQLATWNQKS